MKLSAEARTQLPSIHRMMRCVKDDGAVASYFRIARHEVQAIRAEMPEEEPRRFKAERYEPEDRSDGSGAHLIACKRAQADSRFLREAIERLYRRFAHNHRLTVEEAKVVNLYGWGTLKRLREREQAPFIGKAAA